MPSNPTGAKNGFVPASELRPLANVMLWWGSVNAFDQAAEEAGKVGIGLAPINEWSGYRNYDLQDRMHDHPDDYGVEEGIQPASAGFSTHGFATALDVISGRDWFIEHGLRWGWSHPYSWDKNHFEHDGHTAIGLQPAGDGGTIVVPPTEKSTMKIAIVANHTPYLVTDRGVAELGPLQLAAFRNGKEKHKGPLGDEYNWSSRQLDLAKRALGSLSLGTPE